MTKPVMTKGKGKKKKDDSLAKQGLSHAGSLIQKHYYSCRVHKSQNKTALMRSNMIKHKSKPLFFSLRRCRCFSLVIPGIFFSETQLLTVNAHTLAAKLSK